MKVIEICLKKYFMNTLSVFDDHLIIELIISEPNFIKSICYESHP